MLSMKGIFTLNTLMTGANVRDMIMLYLIDIHVLRETVLHLINSLSCLCRPGHIRVSAWRRPLDYMKRIILDSILAVCFYLTVLERDIKSHRSLITLKHSGSSEHETEELDLPQLVSEA